MADALWSGRRVDTSLPAVRVIRVLREPHRTEVLDCYVFQSLAEERARPPTGCSATTISDRMGVCRRSHTARSNSPTSTFDIQIQET
jgi:hypothetical protein